MKETAFATEKNKGLRENKRIKPWRECHAYFEKIILRPLYCTLEETLIGVGNMKFFKGAGGKFLFGKLLNYFLMEN